MKNEIVNLGVTDRALAILENKYKVVPDASTVEGYQEIKDAKSELVPIRTSVEKERKLQVAEAIAHQKNVNNEAKRITLKIESIEAPFYAAKKEVDDKEKRIEQEKLEAEKLRIESIELIISNIKDFRSVQYGTLSTDIKMMVNAINRLITDFDFQEFEPIAKEEYEKSLSILNIAIDASAKIEEERKNQEKIRIKQEEKQKEIEEKQAELDRENTKRQEELNKKQAEIDKANAIKEAELAEKQRLIDEENLRRQLEIDKKESEILRKKKYEELKEDAIKEEKERVKKEKELEKQKEIEREKDINHRKLINNEAVKCLIKGGINEVAAKKCITLIAKMKVSGVKIFY